MSADSIISKNLLEAIQKGREDEVEARLRLGEDVNSVFVMNRTPLHCAVANKMTRIVENLLKHKPNLTVSTIHKSHSVFEVMGFPVSSAICLSVALKPLNI